jgi:hypothetical protein
MTIKKLTDQMWSEFMGEGNETDTLVVELQQLWKRELPGLPVPDEKQFQRWLRGNRDPSALVYAMTQAQRRMARQSWGDETHCIAYISSVNNRKLSELAEKRQEQTARRAA